MVSVYNYINYRKFLADYYQDKKSKNNGFSFQVFANKAGFIDKGFLCNIMKGNKNLSKESIVKICDAIDFTPNECDYFSNLVLFNQAKTHRDKNFYYQKLTAVKTTNPKGSEAQKLRVEQFEYYSNWHHDVIRSLVDMYPVKDDYQWLAKMLYPRIFPKEAKKSIQLLLKLGLIKKDEKGKYAVTSKSITTGKEVESLALQQFHLEAMQRAASALKELQRNQRHITGLTLGISQDTYNLICERIFSFQEEIMALAEADNEANRVYHLNFQFFPVSGVDQDKMRET
jgi:uncharacterized protein (TIGR02147 family)